MNLPPRFKGGAYNSDALILFAELQTFMDVTARLMEQHVEQLTLVNGFFSDEVKTTYNKRFMAEQEKNLQEINETDKILFRLGLVTVLPHPEQTGFMTVNSFMYSPDDLRYVAIASPQPQIIGHFALDSALELQYVLRQT